MSKLGSFMDEFVKAANVEKKADFLYCLYESDYTYLAFNYDGETRFFVTEMNINNFTSISLLNAHEAHVAALQYRNVEGVKLAKELHFPPISERMFFEACIQIPKTLLKETA